MEQKQVLAALRRQRGLTQEQLAEQIGVSRQAISKWETGAAQPDVDNIRVLSDYFGVSTDVFLKPDQVALPIPPAASEKQAPRAPGKSRGIGGPAQPSSTRPGHMAIPGAGIPVLAAPSSAVKGHRPIRLRGLALLGALTVLLCGGCVLTPVLLHRLGFVLRCAWLPGVTATVAAALFALLGLILWRRCKAPKWTHAVLAAAMAVCTALALVCWGGYWTEYSGYTRIITTSPDGARTLLFRVDKQTGEAVYYRERFPMVMKPCNTLSLPIRGEPKTHWTAADVCAITYEGADGAVHQHVATFGDRGSGSYYDVATVLYGSWAGQQAGTGDWHIRATDGRDSGITLELGSRLVETYAPDECVQFGTIALVLCRGGLPRWTITLNPDCTVHSGFGRIDPGGTITLSQVSLQDTPDYVFFCEDDAQKAAEQSGQSLLPVSWEQQIQETIRTMQALSEQETVLPEALPDSVEFLPETSGSLSWRIFLSLVETDDAAAAPNGVDRWDKAHSFQLIAGDETDGCYRVEWEDVCTSPGNQGGAPSAEASKRERYVRLVRMRSGAYLVLQSSIGDLTYGLQRTEGAVVDVSQNDAYHRFEPADYSGEQWKYQNVTRLSPGEACTYLYETELTARYPSASPLEDNIRAGLRLDENGTILLYDGIWQVNDRWVYRFWLYRASSGPITEWNGAVETLAFYDVDFFAYEKSIGD